MIPETVTCAGTSSLTGSSSVQKVTLQLDFWIKIWCKWQTCYYYCTAHVITEINAFADFAPAPSRSSVSISVRVFWNCNKKALPTDTHQDAARRFGQTNEFLELGDCIIEICCGSRFKNYGLARKESLPWCGGFTLCHKVCRHLRK